MSDTILTSAVFECSQRLRRLPSAPYVSAMFSKPYLVSPALSVALKGEARVSAAPGIPMGIDGIWNYFAWQKQRTLASGGMFKTIGTPCPGSD